MRHTVHLVQLGGHCQQAAASPGVVYDFVKIELNIILAKLQQASFVSSGALQRLDCSLCCKNTQTSFPAFVCGRLNYCNSLFTGVPLGINGARPAHTKQFADLCTSFYRGLAALVTYDLHDRCLSSTVYFYGTSWSAPILLCWLSFSHYAADCSPRSAGRLMLWDRGHQGICCQDCMALKLPLGGEGLQPFAKVLQTYFSNLAFVAFLSAVMFCTYTFLLVKNIFSVFFSFFLWFEILKIEIASLIKVFFLLIFHRNLPFNNYSS